MNRALDKATIVNWALAELGLAPTFTIDDDTNLGGRVAIFWPRAEARCFGVHDWTFCRQTLRLDRLAATPENGWPYGFQLPGARLSGPMMLTADPQSLFPLRDYVIEGTIVFARETDLWARLKLALDPEAWPVDFAEAFAVSLASFLAVPLLQDSDLRDDKRVEAFGTPSLGGAGGLFGRLIAQDLAASPIGSPLLVSDPLTAARW